MTTGASNATVEPPSEVLLSERSLRKLELAGFCLDNTERRKYIKTVASLGEGSFGKVREAYRQPSSLVGIPTAGIPPSSARIENASAPSASGLCCAAETAVTDPRSPKASFSRRSAAEDDASLSVGHSTYIRVAIKEMDLTSIHNEKQRMRVVAGAVREARLLHQVRGAAHLLYSYRPWYNHRRGRLCLPLEMADMDLMVYLREWNYNPPEGYLFAITRQLLQALQELHEHCRIVHRDVKLENFLVFLQSRDREPPIIKLGDFGLSATENEAEDGVCGEPAGGHRVGTPYFMAPECYTTQGRRRQLLFRGGGGGGDDDSSRCSRTNSSAISSSASSVSSTSATFVYGRDVWALGCIIFILVNGALPFPWNPHADPGAAIVEARAHLSRVPRWAGAERGVLHQLALRCLEVELSSRPTVTQLLQELDAQVDRLRLSPESQEVLHRHFVRSAGGDASVAKPLKLYHLRRLCRPGYSLTVYATYPGQALAPAAAAAVVGSSPATPTAAVVVGTVSFGAYILIDMEFDLPLPSVEGGVVQQGTPTPSCHTDPTHLTHTTNPSRLTSSSAMTGDGHVSHQRRQEPALPPRGTPANPKKTPPPHPSRTNSFSSSDEVVKSATSARKDREGSTGSSCISRSKASSSRKESSTTRPTLVTQRWAKVVYPVKGYCRCTVEGQALAEHHHVFHPFHWDLVECPALPWCEEAAVKKEKENPSERSEQYHATSAKNGGTTDTKSGGGKASGAGGSKGPSRPTTEGKRSGTAKVTPTSSMRHGKSTRTVDGGSTSISGTTATHKTTTTASGVEGRGTVGHPSSHRSSSKPGFWNKLMQTLVRRGHSKENEKNDGDNVSTG